MSEEQFVSLQLAGSWLWRARYWIVLGLVLGALAGFGASLLMHPTYRASAVVVPVSNAEGAGGGLSGLLSQAGGLGALAGLGGSFTDNRLESMAVLNSRALVTKFLIGHHLVELLGKTEGEREQSGQPDEARTLNKAVSRFKKRMLLISEDRRAGTVTVSVDWKDPVLAAQWANDLVSLANEDLRNRAIDEAQLAMKYLNSELDKVSVVGVRETLYKLVEGQLKTISTANSRRDYAFRVVDPATVPDKKDFVSPNRVLLSFGGAFLGMVIGSIIFLRRLARSELARGRRAEATLSRAPTT